MTKSKYLMIALAMLTTAGLAFALTPHERIGNQGPKVNLETMIPKQFGGWILDETIVPLLADPSQTKMINEIYNQTLSRTYVNPAGDRVMLSIAYGGNQSKELQVHKPEVCYVAQGFQIGKLNKSQIETPIGQIPVMNLVATQGARIEPITYWIRMGNSVTRGWFEQNLARISYGLTGKVPDGMLVRVSSISSDEKTAYKIQQIFLTDMLQGIRKEDQAWLVGKQQDS